MPCLAAKQQGLAQSQYAGEGSRLRKGKLQRQGKGRGSSMATSLFKNRKAGCGPGLEEGR